MFVEHSQKTFPLSDEVRKGIWQGSVAGRLKATLRIYDRWYTRLRPEGLPAEVAADNWWPDDNLKVSLAPSARLERWLTKYWPDLADDATTLTALCWPRRSDAAMVADLFSCFWANHMDKLHYVYLARTLPAALGKADPAGLAAEHEAKADQYFSALVEGRELPTPNQGFIDELLDDAARWEDFVEWFFTHALRWRFPVARALLDQPPSGSEGGGGGGAVENVPKPRDDGKRHD